jgi:hypothetical protein
VLVGLVDVGGAVGGLRDDLFDGVDDGRGRGAGGQAGGRCVVETEVGVEVVPADAAGELEEAAELEGVDEVDAGALGRDVGDGGDVAGAGEDVGRRGGDKVGGRDGVDLVDGVAGADGVGDFAATLGAAGEVVLDAEELEAGGEFGLVPEVAFDALDLQLVAVDGDLRGCRCSSARC